ncbi:hypothetical protein EDD86DRAFT_208142 [Gorgonomyces haynaldii]|nr:hypothetical protein EDD86DRAFT_208142 [Gorgonomyces haynaldii]
MHFVEQSNKLVFKEGELKEPDQVGQVFLCHMLDDKLVLKNYLEKCLTATKYGNIECYKDAVGEPEMWKLVTLEDGFALQSMFGGYLGRDGDALRCDAQEISESETFKSIIQYRAKKKEAKEELKLAVSIEKELFQSYHAKGMGSHTVSLDYRDVQHLEKARKEGRLHEELVKKREKLKSDKFCK